MPVGSGAHRYARVQGWPQLPADITLGWIGSVAVDSRGRVYCVGGPTPWSLTPTAELDSWGDDLLNHAHGVA